MNQNLEGKTALVTGASRGIGRSIAKKLAGAGALVAVHYGANRDKAEQTVQEILTEGGNAFTVGADISSMAQIETMFAALDAEFLQRTGSDALDILVNNAGTLVPGKIDSYTEADFDRQFNINVKSVFFITQNALTRLRDGGRIINVTSGTTRKARPGLIVYAAAKSAVNYFTLALASQLGPNGITVNSLSPGVTGTDMGDMVLADPQIAEEVMRGTALGRIGSVNDISDVAAFLASSQAGWITGQIIHANGGQYL